MPSRVIRRRRPRRARGGAGGPSRKFTAAVKKVINKTAERHSKCTSGSNSMSTSWAYVATLGQQIAEGDGSDGRSGLEIHARFIRFRYKIQNADGTNAYRLAFIGNDKNTSPVGMPSTTYGCFGNTFYSDGMKLLHDQRLAVNDNYSGQNKQVQGEILIPLNKTVKYANFAAAYPDMGGVWLAILSDSSVVTHPTISWEAHFVFNEK